MKKTIRYTLNAIPNTLSQKGFSPVIILIAASVVIGIAAITYGYFVLTSGQTQPQINQTLQKVTLTEKDPLQSKVGTADCPEIDYTGCDFTGDFMTWEDDGLR